MSLLYECISGIIQGGILEGQDANRERDEVAELCVGKLRGMIAVDGDPNRKMPMIISAIPAKVPKSDTLPSLLLIELSHLTRKLLQCTRM